MSTPMSVKERIAMMSANKGSPSSSTVSTTSNPAANASRTSVADRLAAMKANSAEPSPVKQPAPLSTPQKSESMENPVGRECIDNPAAYIKLAEPSIEVKASEAVNQRRPSTIADRIAALNKPQPQEPIQPLPELRPKSAKIASPVVLSNPEVEQDIVKEKVRSPSIIAAANQPTSESIADNAPNKQEGTGNKTPTTPKKEEIAAASVETSTTRAVEVTAAVTPTESVNNNNNDGENSASKPGGVAAKIAAMKSGAVALPMFSPPTGQKEGGAVRRMSSDMKNLGAKINLGGLIPGAPRPPMPRPQVHYAEETVTEENNITNRTSLSETTNEKGELHHASLSRPAVNATRKRAVSSVKLSAAWREELDSEDAEYVIVKRSISTSAATETTETVSTLTAAAAAVSENNDTTTTAEL